MATVYKRARDRGKKRAPYWVQFIDQDGKRRTKKGYSDKGLTEQLAAKLENAARLRRDGLIDKDLEEAAHRRKLPIEEQLSAFEATLRRRKTTPKHVRLTLGRVRLIVTDAGFETAADIDVESVEQVLHEMLDEDGIGHKTYNHYLQAMDQFCKFLSHGSRAILPGNPLAGAQRLNCEVDVRHRRRALTPHEFEKLVESARSSGVEIQCFDGEQRARIYILSYMTGLRRKEIASLTPASFDLEAAPPTLTVEAACSKHRRKDVLPLHPELATALRHWLAGLPQDQLLFPKLAKRRTWLMVRKDLERVGIPYETEEGIADFHAAGRHTHITELLRNGAKLTEAKELARHSDVRMTMRYTHHDIEDRAKAVAKLPADQTWLHIGCSSGVRACPEMSSGDTGGDGENTENPNINPCQGRGLVAESRRLSPHDASDKSGGGGDRTRRHVSATSFQHTTYGFATSTGSGMAADAGLKLSTSDLTWQ